ncbi:hypothetical protein D8811_00910 [Streptococcus gordonii]|uniref:DUF1372 family protein n=1 Tax=Streptococcus gordonii TaxID=1302 RepID=UPI000F66C044|nr:DUF1372 family protein [Streptococcus gordonii]RSJ59158.1 hypothetical protein D8811_00910 [Streptococcus gordonii]RSK10036.1 hypothetical protein D8806_07085 [Streptococcus gordonii]
MTEIKLILFMASCIISFYAGAVLSKPKQPIIIYQVNNAGAEMHGRITDKEIIDGRYTVTAGAYGKFLVTEKQYNQLGIGDEIPDYLKGRGK